MIFDGNGIGCYKTPSLDSGTTKILGTQKQDQSIIFFWGGGVRFHNNIVVSKSPISQYLCP